MAAQDLPPREGLAADATGVAPVGVCDHLLQPPNAISRGAEAADAMAGVEALVLAEVFELVRTGAAFTVLICGAAVLERPLGPGHREDVQQVNPAGTRQGLVRKSQLQLHVQVVFVLGRVDPLPNPSLSGGQGAVGGGRAAGGAPGGADAGLLRLGYNCLHTLRRQSL